MIQRNELEENYKLISKTISRNILSMKENNGKIAN